MRGSRNDSVADRGDDRLTHGTIYANEIARPLSLPGNPEWKMLGTHRPSRAEEGVAHEGYGGWTWGRFASHFEPNPDGTYRKRSSPFVYLGDLIRIDCAMGQGHPRSVTESIFRPPHRPERPLSTVESRSSSTPEESLTITISGYRLRRSPSEAASIVFSFA